MGPPLLPIVPSSHGNAAETYELPRIGGKAYHLQQVHALNLHVPRSWVIPTDEYIAHLGQPPVEEALRRLRSDDSGDSAWALVQDAVLAAPVRPPLAKVLSDFCNRQATGTGAAALAVRSSADIEDGQRHSFAGIFTSVLDLSSAEEVLNGVKRCWSSVWSLRAAAYCRRIGMPPQRIRMALLLQEMIPAYAEGVAFTCDPVSLNPRYVVIEATTQRSAMVVSGRVSPEYYKLSSDTGEVRAHDSGAAGGGSLSDAALGWLWRVVNAITKHFEDDQEIEWIIDTHGRGYILQTRPITTVHRLS